LTGGKQTEVALLSGLLQKHWDRSKAPTTIHSPFRPKYHPTDKANATADRSQYYTSGPVRRKPGTADGEWIQVLLEALDNNHPPPHERVRPCDVQI
jgi:hypothetical protein